MLKGQRMERLAPCRDVVEFRIPMNIAYSPFKSRELELNGKCSCVRSNHLSPSVLRHDMVETVGKMTIYHKYHQCVEE